MEFVITLTHDDLTRLKSGEAIRLAAPHATVTLAAGNDDEDCNRLGGELSGSRMPLAEEAKR
jgi:hypothetical protein